LRAEGFFCNLDVLYGDLGIGKLYFFCLLLFEDTFTSFFKDKKSKRNCNKCRNGENLEAISFKEEAEQTLIEDSVELGPMRMSSGPSCPSLKTQSQA
jgi:hypothetical protein